MTLWGGIYPGAKLGLREMPVLSFTYLRILLAVIVLFVVSGNAQSFRFPRAFWRPLLQAGFAWPPIRNSQAMWQSQRKDKVRFHSTTSPAEYL